MPGEFFLQNCHVAMKRAPRPKHEYLQVGKIFGRSLLTHGFMWKTYASTPWCLILRCQDLTRPFEENLPGTLKPGMGDGVGKISDDARNSLENLRRKS